MHMHAQDIARDISMFGTSKKRYGKVLLIEVPESEKRVAASQRTEGNNESDAFQFREHDQHGDDVCDFALHSFR